MTIPSTKILKKNASERLAASENASKIILICTGIVTALSALVVLINYALGLRINQTGGLGSMGLRSVLSTVQTVLPIIQSVVLMCLELGYLAAMLRVCRQQYTSPKTLKLGFDRFWLLLRCAILQGVIYMTAGIAAFWVSIQLYLLTPLSRPVLALLEPLAANSAFSPEMLLEPVLLEQLSRAMLPLYGILGLLFLLLAAPISYSLRMVNYVIIDKPGISAFAALRESRMMMRGSRMRLFKLDLSLWWWYLLNVLVGLLCYGDVLLGMLGISLPMSADIAYFLFYALALGAQFALFFLLRNRVEVIYAQVYEARRPRPRNDGVVLGNIFQM